MIQKDKDELEGLIDRNTLADVLYTLDEICLDKADHIKETYGNGDADPWEYAAQDINDLAQDIKI